MEEKRRYIDLHIHTNNSDGVFTPKEIVDIANENQTCFLAISDHDTINGILEFENSLFTGMLGVYAVEFSSYIIHNDRKIKLHILGYGFDKDNREFLFLLNEMRQKRIDTHIKLLESLKQNLKRIPEESISRLDMERYCWFDRELIRCMEFEKYPVDVIEQYKKYFKYNRFSYGDEYDLDVSRVITQIKNANGFAVLAHPMSYGLDRDTIKEIILKLSKLGIDGIEVYQSDCIEEDSLFLKKTSEDYNILYSAGSDFHGLLSLDGRMIGRGINGNLCVEETSLTNKILEKKSYLSGTRR